MIRSMEIDWPRATLFAFVLVVVLALSTRRVGPALAVIGSLVTAIIYTVGAAAALDEAQLLELRSAAAHVWHRSSSTPSTTSACEPRRATHRRFRSGGSAIGLCSLTTMLGYGSLLFADNQALASFGRYAIGGEFRLHGNCAHRPARRAVSGVAPQAASGVGVSTVSLRSSPAVLACGPECGCRAQDRMRDSPARRASCAYTRGTSRSASLLHWAAPFPGARATCCRDARKRDRRDAGRTGEAATSVGTPWIAW